MPISVIPVVDMFKAGEGGQMAVPQSFDSALAHELSLARHSFLVSTEQRKCLRVSIPIKIRNRDAE